MVEYFMAHRRRWEDFYASERYVFEKIAAKRKQDLGRVLDVGCACGGLGSALNEKFRLTSYTGVDIHDLAIDYASGREFAVPAVFIKGDIVELKLDGSYDTVVSLSCADWNIETSRIINACWRPVEENGYFVISLRLTAGTGVNDITRSFQYIDDKAKGSKREIANYAVLNYYDALSLMKGLSPSPGLIGAYGYWGKPSSTAVTPYEDLVFAVFYLRKRAAANKGPVVTEMELPL
jgi:trans-aconitate methyltransferase